MKKVARILTGHLADMAMLVAIAENVFDAMEHVCSPETLDFIYPSLVHGKEEQNRKANFEKNQIHNPLQNQ